MYALEQISFWQLIIQYLRENISSICLWLFLLQVFIPYMLAYISWYKSLRSSPDHGTKRSRYASNEEMYNRDDATQDAQLNDRCQRIEDTLGTLANQVVALAIANRPCKRLVSLHAQEKGNVLDDITTNRFTRPKEGG